MIKQLYLVSLLILPLGCGDREPAVKQPFEFTGAKVLAPGEAPRSASDAPKLVIPLRAGVGPIRPGDKIGCEVKLTAPSKRVMPTAVHVDLLQGDRICDSTKAEPYRADDAGVYTLRAVLEAPKKAGLYQLRATAIDAEIHPAHDQVESVITPLLTRSPSIEVKVSS